MNRESPAFLPPSVSTMRFVPSSYRSLITNELDPIGDVLFTNVVSGLPTSSYFLYRCVKASLRTEPFLKRKCPPPSPSPL